MRNHLVSANRAPLAYLLLSLIAGLLLARIFPVNACLLGFLVFASAILAVQISRKQGWAVGLWGLIFLLSGTTLFWSYRGIRLPATPDTNSINQAPREERVKMEILHVFNTHTSNGKRINGIARVLERLSHHQIEPGQRLYFNLEAHAYQLEQLHKGVQLISTGVIRPIRNASLSSFDRYLRNSGVYYRFSQNASLEIICFASPFQNFCVEQNLRFQKILNLGAEGADPEARIYSAMLLGQQSALTENQKQRFQSCGAMHLFAISGLHIGVMAAVLAACLRLMRIPNRLAPFLGLPMLYLFVEITGGSPSAMRAFLMTLFFWTAFTLQRQRNAFAALIASAIGVLLVDPLQLWSLGFQLSYLVVASILLFGLPLQLTLTNWAQPFRWLPENDWSATQRILQNCINTALLLFAVSFSAWIASMPLSLGHFGYFSLPAVFVNMALVNMAALVICTGALSLACGLLLSIDLAAFINHAAWLVIACMNRLSEWVAAVPGVVVASPDFPLLSTYLALLTYFTYLIFIHQKPTSVSDLKILVAPALLIFVLFIPLIWV